LDTEKNRQFQRLNVLALYVRTLTRRIAHLSENNRADEADGLREYLDRIFDELVDEFEDDFEIPPKKSMRNNSPGDSAT
jgi:hypothetical protein